ncbi:MAG TPA: DUF998 domain-containing protein [Solirubrobacterales bacterium]|nr:DUF998 domain-containing protein [Solirubrobacterales bacterium]
MLWLAFVLFGGLWEPGYSEVRDAVSFLGARDSASPWVFDTLVAISGLSLIALAAALTFDGPRGLRGRLGPALIAFTGLAQILDGFPFPADCRRTIDAGCHAREVAGELSWQHYAHGWTYFFGGLALLLSVFAMAWRFRGDPRWGRSDLLAFAGGIIAIVIFGGLFFFTGKGFEDHYGLAQRFALVSAGMWISTLALALLDLYGRQRFLGRTATKAMPVSRA